MSNLYYLTIKIFILITFSSSVVFGQITFLKTFGNEKSDWTRCFQQLPDSGYIITGVRDVEKANGNMFLLKTDKFGNTLWNKTYHFSRYQKGLFLTLTLDGGYIISGNYADSSSHTQRQLLLKTDSDGDTLWTRRLCVESENYNCVIELKDSSLVFSGTMVSPDSTHWVGLLKMDKNGNILWEKKCIEGDGGVNYLIQSSDGGFVLTAGWAFAIKTDADGNVLWRKTLVQREQPNDGAYGPSFYSIANTRDNGYLFVGTNTVYQDYETKYQMLFIKTNAFGDTLWMKLFTANNEGANSIESLSEGGFIVSGSLADSGFLLKINEDGNTIWKRLFKIDNYNTSITFAKKTLDGGFAACGNFSGGLYERKSDLFLLKTDDNGNTTRVHDNTEINDFPLKFNLSQNFPNPFNPSTKITYNLDHAGNTDLSVYDVLGRKIETLVYKYQEAGQYTVEFNVNEAASNVANGIYLYVLKNEFGCAVKKMVYLK